MGHEWNRILLLSALTNALLKDRYDLVVFGESLPDPRHQDVDKHGVLQKSKEQECPHSAPP